MDGKIMADFVVEHYLSWHYGITLEELEDEIIRLKELNATHIEFEVDDDDILITAYTHRLETDREFELRKRHEELQEQKELAELARLKEKYEK